MLFICPCGVFNMLFDKPCANPLINTIAVYILLEIEVSPKGWPRNAVWNSPRIATSQKPITSRDRFLSLACMNLEPLTCLRTRSNRGKVARSQTHLSRVGVCPSLAGTNWNHKRLTISKSLVALQAGTLVAQKINWTSPNKKNNFQYRKSDRSLNVK